MIFVFCAFPPFVHNGEQNRSAALAPILTKQYVQRMESVDIFNCADHREFLGKSLESRKTLGVRGLARKAGIKSPGLISMLLKGDRRLTRRSAEMLARALELKGRRKAIFLAFARLDSARSEEEKFQAREEILKLKCYRPEFRLKAKQFSFLAKWHYPVLYTMAENLHSRVDARVLAAHLGRGITEQDVNEAFRDLLDLGLLEQTAAGGWRQAHAAISTPDEMKDLAIAKYHRNMGALAIESLALPLDEREFNGLTVKIPKRLLPKVKEKVRRFRAELNELLSAEPEAGDIFQMNFQIFPLTNGLERIDS